MKVEALAKKYVDGAEKVLDEKRILQTPMTLHEEKIRSVIETAKRYIEDAKYYGEREKFETSLASAAYCEGLLDALRLLGAVDFSW
jgi:FAD synthetase